MVVFSRCMGIIARFSDDSVSEMSACVTQVVLWKQRSKEISAMIAERCTESVLQFICF